jgi:protein TonB
LKDIDQGIETLLNTREFKYYTYYNRIRKQLSQFWEPKVREKVNIMFQQGRKVASAQDRITKLLIVLNSRGTLVNVKVISDSGVRDLDDAAVEAFRAAAPFPNPPKGIIETDGTVKIRWDFVLET